KLLRIETRTVTQPAGSTSKNGDGTAHSTSEHYTKNGLMTFTKSASGRINCFKYSDVAGRLTNSTQDAKPSEAGDVCGQSVPTGFTSSTSATDLLRRTRSYAYDPQGRTVSATLPTGRRMAMFYSRLADPDGRTIQLAIPRWDTIDDVDSFYGPV